MATWKCLRRRVPAEISSEQRYWSGRLFEAWCRRAYGTNSIDVVAGHLGISRMTAFGLMRDRWSPNLETYLRLLARAGVPLGTWLAHLPACTERLTCDAAGPDPPSERPGP